MNVIKNTIGIFVFAMLLIGLIIVFSIGNALIAKIYDSTTSSYAQLNVNSSKIDSFKTSIDNTFSLLISGIDFLIMFIMILTLYSSFISRNTLTEYISLFIINLMISSIFIYAFHMIYNAFVIASSTVEILNLDVFNNFIFVNFDNLIVLNTIAFLLSFVFKRLEGR